MRSFVLRVVLTSLRKKNIRCLFLKSILIFFKKLELAWFRLFATTFSPLRLKLFNLIFVLLAI
jgi:hypothetical protein